MARRSPKAAPARWCAIPPCSRPISAPSRCDLCWAHDLFRKPVPTFRDHALMLVVDQIDLFHGDAQALDGVSLDVPEGTIVAIVGANGAGKTSLIRAIAGMHRPAHGRIVFRGTDIAGWP